MKPLRAISYGLLATPAGVAIGFALLGTASQEVTAGKQATFATSTNERSLRAPVADLIQTSTLPVAENPPNSATSQPSFRGSNPLWAPPLPSLTATRERPIFSPSRRQPATVIPPVQPQPRPLTNQPLRPLLVLVGAIAEKNDGIAIFLDETTKSIVRLKTGESHLGWTLLLLKGREATLQRDRETAILAIATLPAK